MLPTNLRRKSMTSRRNESVNALNLEKTLKDDFKSEGLLVDLYFHFKHVFQEKKICFVSSLNVLTKNILNDDD